MYNNEQISFHLVLLYFYPAKCEFNLRLTRLNFKWSNVLYCKMCTVLHKWTFAGLCSVLLQECLLINLEMMQGRWCAWCDLEREGRWTGSEWRVGVSLVRGVSVPWLDPHSSTAPSNCFCWCHPQQWTSSTIYSWLSLHNMWQPPRIILACLHTDVVQQFCQ